MQCNHMKNTLIIKEKKLVGRENGLYQTTCISFPYLNLHLQTTSIRESENIELDNTSRYNLFYPTEEEILIIDSALGLEGVERQLE